jgi:hypothetical protein
MRRPAAAVAIHPIMLRSDLRPAPESRTYRADAEVAVGDVIVVDGMNVLVEDVRPVAGTPPVLECRRLWRLRLVDREGRPAGPGFIVNEQRHHAADDTLVLEAGERFRVRAVQDSWPAGFDGSLVVDRVADPAGEGPTATGETHA